VASLFFLEIIVRRIDFEIIKAAGEIDVLTGSFFGK
jgi:hypothetical protein